MRPSNARTKKYGSKLDGNVLKIRAENYDAAQKKNFKSEIQDQVRIEKIVKNYLSSHNIASILSNYYILFAKKCVQIKNKVSGNVAHNESLIEKQKWFSRGLDSDHLEAIRLIFIPIPIIEIMSLTKYRKSGNYHNSFVSGGAINQAITANRLYAYPFYVPENQSFDEIAIYVNALSAGTARLGIYYDNGVIYPGNLLIDAGQVDVGSTGSKTIVISQILTPGLYWLVFNCSSTPTLRGTQGTYGYSCIGAQTMLGGLSGNFYVDSAYGLLPNTFPAGSFGATTPYFVWIRKA